jgi:hypothetical protein
VTPLSLELWYAALAEPLGICIQTSDPERARQRLYQLRTKANDPDLEKISVVASPTDPKQLWLIKK